MIRYTTVQSIFGDVTIATMMGKLTCVEFGEPSITKQLIVCFEHDATDIEDNIVKDVIACINLGREYTKELHLIGSAFQQSVWDALRKIKAGDTVSYKSIATMIGSPKAYRAVGTACKENPIAIIIPCHRVIKSSGQRGEYRWGTELKKKLLDREYARLPISEQICRIEDKKVFAALDKAVKDANKTI